MFGFKKKAIPEWQREVLEDKKLLGAKKESYLQAKIQHAKIEGKELAQKESQKPKSLAEQVGSFFGGISPQQQSKGKTKSEPLFDHMAEMGKFAMSNEGMFGNPFGAITEKHDKTKRNKRSRK